MEIERCYDILEIEPGAGLEEIKRAHRDLAAVWHPDRFSASERLREKASGKIKEINAAYQTLIAWKEKGETNNGRRADGKASENDASGGSSAGRPGESQLEQLVEAGTGVLLTACWRLSRAVKRWMETQHDADHADPSHKDRARGSLDGQARPGRGRRSGSRGRHMRHGRTK